MPYPKEMDVNLKTTFIHLSSKQHKSILKFVKLFQQINQNRLNKDGALVTPCGQTKNYTQDPSAFVYTSFLFSTHTESAAEQL